MRIQGQPGSGRAKSGMRPPDFCFPTLSSDKCAICSLLFFLPPSIQKSLVVCLPPVRQALF